MTIHFQLHVSTKTVIAVFYFFFILLDHLTLIDLKYNPATAEFLKSEDNIVDGKKSLKSIILKKKHIIKIKH